MENKHYIEYLRVFAIVAVVSLHTTAYFYKMNIGEFEWWIANFINAFTRFSVPMFIMISGAVLLGRAISLENFYKKRTIRLIPPFVFWSIVYILFHSLYFEVDKNWLLTLLIKGKVNGHLWYLSMFICLMLFVPFLNKFLNGEKPTSKDLLILLSLLFVYYLVNDLSKIVKITLHQPMGWYKSFPWFIAYFVAGYYIDKYSFKFYISKFVVIFIIFFIIILGTVLNYYVYFEYHILKDYFILSNDGFLVFLIAILLFYIFKTTKFFQKERPLITKVSDASFGIYLIHPIFLYLLRDKIENYTLYPISMIFFTIIVTTIISFLLINSLRKIPLMRKVT